MLTGALVLVFISMISAIGTKDFKYGKYSKKIESDRFEVLFAVEAIILFLNLQKSLLIKKSAIVCKKFYSSTQNKNVFCNL